MPSSAASSRRRTGLPAYRARAPSAAPSTEAAVRAGEGALADRRGGEAGQSRPDGLLHLGRDQHFLMREQRGDPFRGPGPLGGMADMAQRLKGDRLAAAGRAGFFAGSLPAKAQRMMSAAHGKHRGAGREALVEDVDLGVRIAPELEGKQSEQNRLAGAGRADDQHVADIADMS